MYTPGEGELSDGLYFVAGGNEGVTVALKVGRGWKWLGTSDLGMEPSVVIGPVTLPDLPEDEESEDDQ